MLKSLSFRINFTILVVVTVIVTVFGWYDYSRDNNNRIAQLHGDLSSAVGRLSTSLATPLWSFNDAELESIARGEMLNDDIIAIVIQERDSEDVLIELARNREWHIQRAPAASLPQQTFEALEAEIKHEGETIGRVRVAVTDRFFRAESRAQAIAFLYRVSAIFLVIVISLMTIIQRYVVKPIRLLEMAFSDTETGTPLAAPNSERTDEIGQLTRSFISMRNNLTSLFSERDNRIAELETARKELLNSEERLRVLIEQSPIGLCLCTLDGSLVTVNSAYAKIIGYSADEALQLSYWDITPEKYAPDETRQLEHLESSGRYGPYEKEYRHKDGHLVPVRLNGMIVERDGESYIWSSVEDIIALKEAEVEKNLLTEQLRQSQKMEAIGTLAGGVAHDFNNILSAVIGYTELTRRNPNCDAKSSENLGHVLTAADRARDLVKQILMFSRKGAENRKPIQLHLVIEEAVKLLRKTIPSTITINLDIDENTGSILADRTQIHQVVMNLCTNAYHSMQEQGGDIDIVLKPVAIDTVGAAKYPNLRQGKYGQFTVSDSGTGMDPKTILRIFDPFFTTKRQGEGTGMGLAVVHGIIQNHDGAIGVESEIGAGTTFKVFFPLSCEAAGEKEKSTDTATIKRGTEHILWVDDEPTLVELGKETLESFGYRVTATTSALEALNIFQADPNGCDLIVTDQTMPEMTGDVLAKEAMLVRSDIPVIICTGHSATLNAEKVRAIGVNSLLMKPLNSDTLTAEIRKVLDASV